jgi:cold shock CspA family protein
MNTQARHSGSISTWIEAEDFGEIALAGFQPIVVYRSELNRAGIHKPAAGMRVDFRIDAGANGITQAVDITRPRVS